MAAHRGLLLAEAYKGKKISSAFVFLRPKERTIALADSWAAKLNGTAYVDDAAALNTLLTSREFKDLTVEVLPSAVFPTFDELTKSTSASLKVGLIPFFAIPLVFHPASGVTRCHSMLADSCWHYLLIGCMPLS